jgi:hypothetical protein
MPRWEPLLRFGLASPNKPLLVKKRIIAPEKYDVDILEPIGV